MSLATASLGVGCAPVAQDRSLFLADSVTAIADANSTFPLTVALPDELAVAANFFSPRHRLLLNTAQSQLGLNSLMAFAGGGYAAINHSHVEGLSFVPKTVGRLSSHASHGYVGLPYQDHNYVAPYPSTPPQSPVGTLSSGAKPAAALTSVGNHLQSTTVSALDDPGTSGLELGEVVVTTTSSGNASSANQPLQDIVNGDDSVTRCICDFQHDDGYMICCDQCGVWQHVDCMRVDRENIPESYLCELCQPRHVDKHRAIQIQTRKRDDLSLLPIDSSATETEDETTQDDMLQPVRKKFKIDDTAVGTGQKRRVKRMSKDDSPKKRLHLKTRSNGLIDNKVLLSPQKPIISRHLSMLADDNAVRHEEMFNGFGYTGVTPTEALFAAVECVTSYQDAACNSYTIELQTLLSNIRFNGQHTGGGPHWPPIVGCAEIAAQLARQQPCRVAPVGAGAKMGIEATDDIITHQPLTEYIGNVMLRDQYDQGNNTFSCAQPYVLFYTKLDGLDLCVDARIHGNEARFVRRSCTPNAEVRHVLDGNTVRFFLHATKSIIRGAEITIPFDFNYHKCLYVVECACTRISCPVVKYQRRESNSVSSSGSRRQRITRSVDSKLSAVSPMQVEVTAVEPPATPNKTVPSSPASINSKHKRPPPLQIAESGTSLPSVLVLDGEASEAEVINAKATPVSMTSPVKPPRHTNATTSTPSSAQAVTMLDSEKNATPAVHSDSDDGEKAKKKTREEKKLEAILKTIERMEKREKLKLQANARIDHSKKQQGKEKDGAPVDNEIHEAGDKELTVDKDQKLANEDTQSNAIETRPRSKSDHHSKSKKNRHSSSGSRRASMSIVNCTSAMTPLFATSSSSSTSVPLVSVTATTVLDETSQLSVQSSQVSPAMAVSVTPLVSSAMFVCASAPVACQSSILSTPTDKLMRPPKKLMMRDHDVRRDSLDMRNPLSVQTDCPASDVVNPGSGNELLSEFMPCVPSPHSHTLSSLRRASTSSASAGGSAKKRWLQKAMYETTTPSTWTHSSASLITTSSPSPCLSTTIACALSPSVGDFVTPLKKRRMARESLSIDDSMPGVNEEDDYNTAVSRVSSVSTSDNCAIRSSASNVSAEQLVDDVVSDASVDGQDEIWSRHISKLTAENQHSTRVTGAATTMSLLLYAAETSLMGTNLVATANMKFDNKEFSEWKHLYGVEQSVLDVDSQLSSPNNVPPISKGSTLSKPYGESVKVEVEAGESVSHPFASLDVNCADSMSKNAKAKFETQQVKEEIPEFNQALHSENNCKVFEHLEVQRERSASGISSVSVSSASAGDDLSPLSSATDDTCNQRSSLSDLIRLITTPKLEKQQTGANDRSVYSPNRSTADVGVSVEKTAACIVNGWPLFTNHKESLDIGKSIPMLPRWRDTAVVTSTSWSGLDALSHEQLSQGLEALKGRNIAADWCATEQEAHKDALFSQTLVNGQQKYELNNRPVENEASSLPLVDNGLSYNVAASESLAWCSPLSEHGGVDRQFSSIVSVPSKKKVSLLEYRQRKSQRSGDTCNVGDEVQALIATKNAGYHVISDFSADRMRQTSDSDTEYISTTGQAQHVSLLEDATLRCQQTDPSSNDVSTPQELVLPSSRSCELFANVIDRVSCQYETARLEAVQNLSPTHTS